MQAHFNVLAGSGNPNRSRKSCPAPRTSLHSLRWKKGLSTRRLRRALFAPTENVSGGWGASLWFLAMVEGRRPVQAGLRRRVGVSEKGSTKYPASAPLRADSEGRQKPVVC